MRTFFLSILIFLSLNGNAQDTLRIDTSKIVPSKNVSLKNPSDSKALLPVKPGVAIRRSAILPGWGQATNKSYWKIPLIYAALGTTTYLFFRNVKQYREARDAYRLASDTIPGNDYLIKEPYFTVKDQPDRIRTFRNQVRQNVDYSALFFVLFWGLNVVDAAVDAHLRTFDVSDDLSLIIKPGHSTMAGTNGISLVLSIK